MVRTCAETYGKIDFVVNTAGMLRERMIWNMTEEDFDLVIGVHLKGTWNMCTHATKMMRNARHGRIVNFSSDAFKGSVGQCNYAAAKAGIIGLTRTIAREAGQYGITANAMCPFAATRMTVNDAVIANWKRRVENGLMTQKDYESRMAMPGPEYIAPMVAYLCTDAAKDVNGQIFHAEKGHYHTYYYGEVKRSIYKSEERRHVQCRRTHRHDPDIADGTASPTKPPPNRRRRDEPTNGCRGKPLPGECEGRKAPRLDTAATVTALVNSSLLA